MKKLFLILLGFSCLFPAIALTNMRITIGNISIDAPPYWQVEYTVEPTLFVIYAPLESETDDFRENCNLTSELLDKDYTTEEFYAAVLPTLKELFPDLKILEKTKTYHIQTCSYYNTPLKQLVYFSIRGNIAYTLTFTSNPAHFDSYKAVFMQIAASLEMK